MIALNARVLHSATSTMFSDKNLTQRLRARNLEREIANLTQRLLATNDAEQSAEIAAALIAAIRDRVDKLRNTH